MLAWDLELETNRWHTTADIPDFYGLPDGPDYTDARNALAAVHPDDVPAVLAGRARALETGEPMGYEFRGSVPAADGGPRWYRTRGRVVRGADGAPVRIVAVTTEITDQRRAADERAVLDRQLQDARRWESLGVLAGGIAHDFNNILTVVMGSAALARRGVPPGPVEGYLDQIERAGQRAAEVCRQMLAYAGRAQSTGDRADLAACAREACVALSRTAGGAIRVEPTGHPFAIKADPAQVRQVVQNLVTNALEAGAPEVTVRFERDEVAGGESDAGFHLAPPPGRYAVLVVGDTGPGMTPDVRDRMFDPFFSTKFTGRGLGLAAVLGIVRAHKGGIRVATAPGRGTTVAVYWPVLAAAPKAVPAAPPAVAALVIEDDPFAREVIAAALEDAGFAPLLAADAPAGLDAFRAHPARVGLGVVTPGALPALRALAPDLPVVLVCGPADRPPVPADARTAHLQKPFHPDALLALVRKLT